MMTQGIHSWCLSISLYLVYSGYIWLWWPWIYIAGANLYHYTLCTQDTHCYDDTGYTKLVLIFITIPCVLWIHMVMMTLDIHCWCLIITLYLMYPGYTLLWWPRVYKAGAYLYHYTLCTLDTHGYDDPGYTLLVLIYKTIPYVPWIHIVMMTQDIHCWCLSISLYLLYSGYTLLWWPRVYIASAYLYHHTLYTLDRHCYDDPGCTLLMLIYITMPYVLWVHIDRRTQGIHSWCLSVTPGYTLLVLIYITLPYVLWIDIVMMTQGTELVPIFITIPYVLWIHIVMMTQGEHCSCLSISLYLMYSG